jgi:poly(hydroxyalkanoate) depolymerase family esterase
MQILDGTFTHDAGTLSYKLYLASSLCRRPPLFVMLHGATQSASDFAAGTRMAELAEECGGIALFPEQSRSAHPLGCWNWYDTRHQFADGGEPSMIVGLTRQVIAEHGVDPARVYVAGMSAGGAMAVILGQAYPDVYAAVGVHSGLPAGAAHDLSSALRTMSNGPEQVYSLPQGEHATPTTRAVPTIVFHGDRDRTVHPLNAAALLAQALRKPGHDAVNAAAVAPTPMTGGRAVSLSVHPRDADQPDVELWMVHGAGHAWTGGSAKGSFTDESGPDASREMLRFFLNQSLTTAQEKSLGRRSASRHADH